MTQKELGYVELEWTCPRCNTRNPGTNTTCSNCGAPQPKDVQFQTPVGGELLQDEAKIARAKSGPDIVCAFCGTRNPASAQVCKQCGADLSQGTAREAGGVVGAFQSTPLPPINCPACKAENPASATVCQNCGTPLPRPQLAAPVAAPPAAGKGVSWGVIIVVALVIGALVFFGVLSLRTQEVTGTVREARWARSIPIEGLVPVEYTGWWDEIPANAEVCSCRAEVRSVQDTPTNNAREVCGTPYTIDTGTGIGRVVQDCQYEVLEDRCSYTVDQWRVVDVVRTNGVGFSPVWPVASLGPRQRQGQGSEKFECVVVSGDQWYTFEPRSFEAYTACQPGSQWQLEINGLGALTGFQPLD
jgi:ribosomal protein L40E